MSLAYRRKWILPAAGGFVLVYCVVVLAFVATSPDLRLRCVLLDEADESDPSQPDRTEGLLIRATPGIDYEQYKGTKPEPGDLLVRIGPRDTRIRNFVDFLEQVSRLRNAEVPPGGKVYAGTDPSEIEGDGLWLVQEPDGKRWVEIEFIDRDWNTRTTTWLLVQSLPLGDVLLSFVWLILHLGVFVFGALAYWNRPFDRPSQLFFAMCIVTLGAFVGGYHWWVVASNLWLNIPFVVCAVLVPVVSLHFFLVFPRPKSLVASRPRLAIALLYAAPILAIVAILSLLGYISALNSGGTAGPAAAAGILEALHLLRYAVYSYFAVAAADFVIALWALWHSYRAARSPMERGQLKWLWRAGVAAAVFVGYALYLAVFRRVEFALGAARIPMFLASLSFLLAYSIGIVRYRMMLVDQIVSKGAVYYVFSSVVTVAFALAVALGGLLLQILNISPLQQQALTAAVVLMFLVILLLWARDFVQQAIDRQFFREKYRLDKALQRMNRAVGHLANPEALAEMMLGSCRDVLGVGRAALYLRTTRGGPFQLVASQGADDLPLQFTAGDELVAALKDAGTLQRVGPGSRGESSSVQAFLREFRAGLVHSLDAETEIAGLVVLGEKPNAASFTAEDLTFLNALGQITNVALHSAKVDRDIARLNEELLLKSETVGDQKRRIALLQAELTSPQGDAALPRAAADGDGFRRDAIRGNSPAMLRVLETVRKVAGSESSVLIRGDSGTGKELLARVLHENSPRRAGPIVAVHCAALSPGLLESELFGHAKGAFTGAHRDNIGRFEMASGGSLFLDEIGDISLETQVKLLRVLQERRFEPVGSMRTVEADVRLITATHQDLERLIAEGRFREDLYYRLNVITITLPPLRERREDILELALHFLNLSARRLGKRITYIDDDALAALERYAWPGNIRELENVIERAVVLADDEKITLDDLPVEVLRPSAVPVKPDAGDNAATERLRPPQISVARTQPSPVRPRRRYDPAEERSRLEEALRQSDGNKAEAARLLGLARSTFFSRLKKHGIE